MGKKNKKSKSAVAQGSDPEANNLPRNVKRETLEISSQLLTKCNHQCCSSSHEWETYMEIQELISRLITIQANYVMKPINRMEHIDEFMKWISGEGVDTSSISIQQYEHGLGLRAEKLFNESELVLSIPRKVMMTTETAKESVLGPVIAEDRILQTMPNVVLALHLLCEKNNPDSNWKHYLNVMPSVYNTLLYFSPDEVQMLKGSPIFEEVINQYRSIARQYAYFFKLFNSPGENKVPLKSFCYEDYRWAVSTVMTRQNKIPSATSQHMSTALIPLWDMANHTSGQLSTDYSVEEDCSKCFALRTFHLGQQVFIFYGSRSNAELLLHNGFVYSCNECDRISIKLGISKNDTLYNMKAEVLARLTLLPSRQFQLHKGTDPVDSDTLAYLRVFNMNEDELRRYLTGENASKFVSRLRDFGEIVSVDNEDKVWQYLKTRVELLLRSYPSTVEEDEELLKGESLSEHSRLCVQLRLGDKRLLMDTSKYAGDYRVRFHQQIQEEGERMLKEKAMNISAAVNDIDEALDDLENLDIVEPV